MNIWLSGCIVLLTINLGNPAYAENQNWPFEFDKGKLVMLKHTNTEALETKKTLKRITDHNIPSGAEGSVIFDCKVFKKLPSDKYGQPAWLVIPQHIFLGREQIPNGSLKIVSPTIENGGLTIQPGQRYRVLAVDFGRLNSGKKAGLYIWATSVLKLK
jgi:hypothetical protein